MDQISPELALVDPELAAEARASLPEPEPEPVPVARPRPVESPAPPRRRSRGKPIGMAAVLGALVLVAASTAFMFDRLRGEREQPKPPLAQSPAAPQPAPPAMGNAAPGTEAHRLYVWAPAKGALYYRVDFLRNGRPFHAAQTADPSLRLPETLRLPPGTYRWSVRPATVGDDGVALRGAILTRTFRVGRG